MRNQLNELKPCEIHLGHFADYCIAAFMKQMQCNVTPSLNIIKTTAKQVWLSGLLIFAELRGQDTQALPQFFRLF